MPETTAPMDQAPQQSIEDAIASKFMDISEEPEQDAAPADADPSDEVSEDAAPEGSAEDFVELEVNGKTFQVPKDIEKAVMQERDYTQKSQALAEQRRQIEFSQKALETARIEKEFNESAQQEIQNLQLLDTYLNQLRGVNTNELTFEDGFRHWQQVQQIKEQKEQIEKSLESKRSEFTKRAESHLESLRAEAREVLKKQIPNLTDELVSQMESHAKNYGYNDHDISMFRVDPRASAVLIKAMKYDQLQATKSAAVQKATPVVKPGSSNPMPQAVKDKLSLRKALQKTSDPQAKARLIAKELESRF